VTFSFASRSSAALNVVTLRPEREIADAATGYGVLQTKFAASSLSPCPEYAA
jgi:hypothetical protein